MKKQFILSSFFAITTLMLCLGQNKSNLLHIGNVLSDSLSINNEIFPKPLISIFDTKNPVEIRFKAFTDNENAMYVILSFDKQWQIRTKNYNQNEFVLQKKSITHIDSLFQVLVKSKIFTLPPQENVPNNNIYFNTKNQTFTMTGIGTSYSIIYIIEYKVADLYRQYQYNDPEYYREVFPLIEEYQNINVIIEVFKGLIQEK